MKKEVAREGANRSRFYLFVFVVFVLFFSAFVSALSGFSLNNSDGSITTNDGFKDIILSYATDGSETSNITDWRFNNVSFAILNLPLDINQTSVNSNSTDFSSFSRNVTSMVAPTYNTSCIKGGCYKFYQNSTIPNLRMNNPLEQNSTSWSISFWIRKDVAPTGLNKLLGTTGGISTCAAQFDLYENINAITINMANSTVTACGSASGTDSFTLPNVFTGKTGIWMQVFLVYNYPNFKVYINGTSAGSFTRVTGSSTKLSPYFYLGGDGYAANSTFDEFKIYNSSLSASEISYLYGLEYSGSQRINMSQDFLRQGNYSVSLSLVDSTSVLSTNISNTISVDDSADCKTLIVGEEYFLPSNVTTITGNCFTLSNNSILNCNGYTLFSKISPYLINNANISPILINNANSSTVKNCNFVSLSSSQNSFAIASNSYNSSFLNNNFISNQSQIVYSVMDSSSNKSYFYNNTFLRSTYQIYGSSSSNSTIFNNSFFCDNTTETNIYYSGGNYHNISYNIFNNASNNTGITIDSSNYSSIHYNYFGSVLQYIVGTKGLQGGAIWLTKVSFTDIYSNFVYIMNQSGIVIVVPDSIISSGNLIHNNQVTIGNNLNVFGMGSTEGGEKYNAYNWSIYNNVIYSSSGTNRGQHTTMLKNQNNSKYYNNSIYYGGYGLVFKDCINSQIYDNYFYNTTFIGIHPKGSKDSLIYRNFLNYTGIGLVTGINIWYDDAYSTYLSDNLTFYDNTILGFGTAINIAGNATNNYFINTTYDGLITTSPQNTSLYWKYWYQPTTVNQLSSLLSGVNITLSNSSSNLYSSLTNSSGTFERVSLIEYVNTNNVSVYFGNYSVSASFLDQLINRSYNLSISHNILDEFIFDDSSPVIEPVVASSGSGSPIFYSSAKNLIAGYNKVLFPHWQVKFTIGSVSHSLYLNNVSNNSATITVSSTPQVITLKIGEEKKLSLTNSSYYDLYVKLNSIYQSKANFTIKSINETVYVAPMPIVQNNTVVNVIPEKQRSYVAEYIIGGLFIVGLVIFIIYRKNYRRFKF